MDPTQIVARLKAAGVKHERIADALGRSRTVAVQIMNGRRPLKVHELPALARLLSETHHAQGDDDERYVPVEVLPAFAGMGGGGIVPDDDREVALVPRTLVEDMFKGRAEDFLLIHTRGDSMEPDFFQGDQLLIDRRDRNPVQPGPFAVRVEDTYVVKNVERAGDGLRLFSSNAKYTHELVVPELTEIIGRPVWVGRML